MLSARVLLQNDQDPVQPLGYDYSTGICNKSHCVLARNIRPTFAKHLFSSFLMTVIYSRLQCGNLYACSGFFTKQVQFQSSTSLSSRLSSCFLQLLLSNPNVQVEECCAPFVFRDPLCSEKIACVNFVYQNFQHRSFYER